MCLHDPANVQHYICWKFAGSLLDRVNTLYQTRYDSFVSVKLRKQTKDELRRFFEGLIKKISDGRQLKAHEC